MPCEQRFLYADSLELRELRNDLATICQTVHDSDVVDGTCFALTLVPIIVKHPVHSFACRHVH